MTTHAPFPTVRRSAAGLLAALLAGLVTAATGGDNVVFYVQPVDSTVVAGHPIAFMVEAELYPATAAYQWYRNDVAIAGATARAYRFTAQPGDHGAQYRVVAQGNASKGGTGTTTLGPTASSQATLTVLAAGSSLTPAITAPAGTNLAYLANYSNFVQFDATGNDLEWTYRFNSEPANTWHLCPAATPGAQAVRFNIAPPPGGTSLTVRVVDDTLAAATRTWQLSAGTPAPVPVQFTSGPSDSTVVEGHTVAFRVTDNLDPSSTPPPAYQWYRNGVAIGGATAARYSFTAQSADQGAQYFVVAAGVIKVNQLRPPAGPTASPTATLTVLPAGSALPPQITEPAGSTFYYSTTGSTYCVQGFRAVGNDLRWSYRFDADAWTVLDAATNGAQYVSINVYPPAGKTSVTVRVVDDASVEATRIWSFVTNRYPTILSTSISATTVPWPGPVTLSVSASDPDGDPLTYVWFVDYAGSVEGGDAVFTPSGASCTATFTKFGKYVLDVAVLDGKGGAAFGAYAKITVEASFDVRTDVNGDGVVNALDLGLVADSFGQVVP